jgi:simple sugar transport system ATP-binding protein
LVDVGRVDPGGTQSGVVLECEGIVKRFGHLEALRGASLTLRAGEILALLGDNGAGKSTLVKCISGVYRPTEGTIRFRGETVDIGSAAYAQTLGIQTIYQDLALAPDLTVLDNFFLGRELVVPGLLGRLGVLSRSRMQTQTESALANLGVRVKSVKSAIQDLSGGQRQAAAVAKAMRWASAAILMDEPTAALGAHQRQIVYRAARTAADQGVAVLMISHDIPQMVGLADRIVILRQGLTVAQVDASDIDTRGVMDLMLGATTGSGNA